MSGSLGVLALSQELTQQQDDPAGLAQLVARWASQHGAEALSLCGEWLLGHSRPGLALDLLAIKSVPDKKHLMPVCL